MLMTLGAEVTVTQNDSTHSEVDQDATIRAQMERMVDSYDSYMRTMTLGRERVLRELTVNLAQVKPGDCVLEAGCGTGTLTLAAKRQAGPSGRAFGIDVIPGMIELSRRKAAQANVDASFQSGSIDDVPFPASQFDVVMCSFMIFHVSDMVRRKGITEIHRVLKPWGRLLVLDLALPTHPIPRAIAQGLLGGMLQHDLGELLPLMEAAGFSDLEMGHARFRVLGLSVIAFVRGSARKS
jgi:ubiquinone/menaquinone biosynthesis C-methylase UbiE